MRSMQTLVALLITTNIPMSRAAMTFDQEGLAGENLVQVVANIDPNRCTNRNRSDLGDGDDDLSQWKLRGCVESMIECCRLAAGRGWVNYDASPNKKACPNTRLACTSGPTSEDEDGN